MGFYMMKKVLSVAGVLSALAASAPVAAEQLPLWEVAFGGGVLSAPHYRGSAESSSYPHPFIFPVYRGKRVKSDESGIRGILLAGQKARLIFSIDGGLPVRDDDSAREGMPRLGAVGQIGPMLRIKLWERPQNHQTLILDLPVRAAFAVNSGIEHIGYTAFPKLVYRRRFGLLDSKWKMGLTAGLLWADEKYHDYYYQVDPEFATPTRPAYDAGGGFNGSRLISTFYHRDDKKFLSFYALYDNVSGAAFEDSPLVTAHDGLTAGFVVSWFLAKSRQRVEVDDWEWK